MEKQQRACHVPNKSSHIHYYGIPKGNKSKTKGEKNIEKTFKKQKKQTKPLQLADQMATSSDPESNYSPNIVLRRVEGLCNL